MEQIKILGLVPWLPCPVSVNRYRTEVQGRATNKFSSWKQCLF